MAAIHVLSRHLVNKIAAGEVIERPASVVKELVENALDAGATRIDVTIEDGGKRLIAVSDDGSGMSGEDLALAFTPHATSKLADEDDLFAIATMGFRGEALASVASVSHAHIRTRRREDDGGHEIAASDDHIEPIRPCPSGAGTTVTIRDLFFNTPARRKFMRTANTEIGHISEQLTRLALPHPQVAFTLTHNGRQTQNLPAAASTAQRAADLLGRELAETLLPIRPRGGGTVQVAGLVAPPTAARGSAKWQYFFLNGRYVRDRVLAHALREAYRGLMDPSRYPVAMVFLRVDPGDVDVNVHPTKIEVRFRDSQAVYGELLAALKETLNKANLTPNLELDAREGDRPSDADEQRRASLREAMADFFKSAPPTQPRFNFGEPPGRHADVGDELTAPHATAPPSLAAFRARPTPPHRDEPPAPGGEWASGESVTSCTPASGCGTHESEQAFVPAIPAVQIHNSYIAAACPEGLIIVDQHALHERLIYNDLRRRLADGESTALTSQRLLIPETLTVTAAEAAALEQCAGLLARLGIEVAPFGPATVAVQRFPALLAGRGTAPDEFLRGVLDTLADDETADGERLLEDLLEMMACKAAVKAGDPLTAEEIDSLLARLQQAEKGSSCPHGRPTTLKLTLRDLEKQFKRT